MKKRILCILLAVVLVAGLSGCGIIGSFLEKKPDATQHRVESGTVPTVAATTEAPQTEPASSPEATEATVEWDPDTESLFMVTVKQPTGAMVPCRAKAINKMGDVFEMTDEPIALPEGDYTLIVESDGYWPHREEITVNPGEEIVLDFELIPEEEVEPFGADSIVVVGDKAYWCDVDGIYCLDASEKVDELGKPYVNPQRSCVYTGELPPYARFATNGMMAYVADNNGVVLEIDLVSGTTRELTEAYGWSTYVCGADRNGVFVAPALDFDIEANWDLYGQILRISLDTGEVEFAQDNVYGACYGGYSYLLGISGGVDPHSLTVYDGAGDPVLELDTVWSVSSMGDKLVISESLDLESSFRVLTYGDDGLEPVYEVTLWEGVFLSYAGVSDGLLSYGVVDNETYDWNIYYVDLYTLEDITGKYPELGEDLTSIGKTGEFKYYCTGNCVYFANGGYIFPMGPSGGSDGYYEYYYVNGCVIEVDIYSGHMECYTPPVA
ncbi:MAG: carboxypeptidase regulatory-like domain-containing protein [Ruminococcaceae bacterium]|nr:carboxypeptidase regulatory-like domain-containing protein [Oscillospiraceae bacterium]